MEFKFWETDFYFLNGSKNGMVATYNFGSVYMIDKLEMTLRIKKKYSKRENQNTHLRQFSYKR